MPQITIMLSEQYEKLSPTNPLGIEPPPLYHQQRTYEALQGNELVINSYNTGTGKTKAALFHLFDLKGENVLFIAPTNELIRQHVEDIQKFVAQYGDRLDFHVLEVNAEKLRELDAGDDLDYKPRNPKKLHELIQNPLKYFPEMKRKKPIILVTNPDIFYLCFYFAYSKLDERNLFADFLKGFDYIVVDEFHYYNAKQLANFLFFFIVSKEYGYFDGTRKVCLLSATPDENLLKYLNRIGLKWVHLSPEIEFLVEKKRISPMRLKSKDEPQEAKELKTIKVLSKLELTLHGGSMKDFLNQRPEEVCVYLDEKKDGAIISGSLYAINEIKQSLKQVQVTDVGLITGAVSKEERKDAAKIYPLVLATPTVDIGYNFSKLNKKRQNIDFLFFDALYTAEFLQRIGRAGRVLGKAEMETSSIAHAFVDGKLITAVDKSGKKVYMRQEFAKLVKETLGEDNRFYYYIDTWAVIESFQPIYRLHKTTLEERQETLKNLFDAVKDAFAPDSIFTFEKLMKRMNWHRTFEDLVRAYDESGYNDYVRSLWRRTAWAYIRNRYEEKGEIEKFEALPEGELNAAIEGIQKSRRHRERIVEYARRQYHLMEALFRFRDSQYGIRCGIFDPKKIFQNTSDHAYYDLLHVITGYEYKLIEWRDFKALTGEWGGRCDFYVQVDDFRSPRRTVSFEYETHINQEEFESQYCNRPTCLKGLTLRLRYRSGGVEHFDHLAPEIADFFKDRHITCLISKLQNRWVFREIVQTKRLIPFKFEVFFGDGNSQEYTLILGTQAFLINAEFKRKWQERRK